jgi:radical SAM superfamily enzyme YgiQ (UPF0313 family)
MKIVLLAINAKYVHSSLSVWLIASGIARFAETPHDVCVVEATINQQLSEIIDSVVLHKADILGVSTYIWNAGMLPSLLNQLQERMPDTLVVLGGPEASFNTEYWIKLGADYVLPGEGEYTFPMLLDELSRGNDAGKIYKPEYNHSDEPVNPYTDTYFKTLKGRISYIETSRGCPFRCSFCLSAGSGVRFFPLDFVKEQILKLSLSGTHTVKFVDRTFNCNAERAYEIFDFTAKLETSCCFHFEVAADLFDERTLKLLTEVQPGRFRLETGLQSFHEPTLEASNRKTNIKKAEKNIRTLLKAQNIHVHLDLIAGLPYETLEDFKKGFDRVYSLEAHTLQLGFLKLLHGSVLRKQAEALQIQYSEKPPYEIISSPWLSENDIRILKQTENALQHTYNKGRFLSAVKYVIEASDSSPFTFFNELGKAVFNHGTQLEEYIIQIYDFCALLPGVDSGQLRDSLMCDWLSMVKGKNTPAFLKNQDSRREKAAKQAEAILGRKPERNEAAVLLSGKGVFADSQDRNPVTGLYKVYLTAL